jgi:hypothetical protein
MIKKIFCDLTNESQQMELFRNSDNRCYIEINTENEYVQIITLDSDDLTEFISELKKIKKQIDNHE